MLQNIRDNSSGIIAKIIVGLIAVTFVVTGVNFFSGGNDDKVIAEVGNIEITERRFVSELERERRQLSQAIGDPAAIDETILRQTVLNGIFEEAQAEYYAIQLGFNVTDQLIDRVIITIPQFQKDGRFDSQLFDLAISQLGLSRLSFREELRRNLIRYQINGSVESSAITTQSELRRLLALRDQKRSGRYSIVSADHFINDINLSVADVKNYYDNNMEQFQTEESVIVEYVLLSNELFMDQVKIDDKDIWTAYQTEIAALEDEIERRARHILIADSNDAKERANTIFEKIQAGENFADLAQKFSDDLASRDEGGDLGFAPLGTFVPAFETVLDELDPNEVSEPLKTKYGYHIIELLETRARKIDPFEIRKYDLEEQLIRSQADRLLQDSLEEFSNIAFSRTLEELSSIYELDVQISDPISRSGGTGLFTSQKAIDKAFDQDLRTGELNADVFEIEPGSWMTFRVASYTPKGQKGFAEIQEQVEELAILETASGIAASAAEKIATRWRDGKTGLPNNLPTSIVEIPFNGIDRSGSETLDSEAIAVAFNTAAPTRKASVNTQAISNFRFTVAVVESLELGHIDHSDRIPTDTALSRIREGQEGSEFWDVVTQKAKVIHN